MTLSRTARRLLGACAAASAVFLLSVASARADVNGFVHGRVIVDGAPRSGATVTLSGSGITDRTLTGANGAFTFTAVPFGTYTLTAHVPGRPDASAAIRVSTDSVNDVPLAIETLPEIGRTVTALRSVSGTPVSENALTQSQITALPQAQSLNSLVETVPGIVKFSYNEPVAHGFHGLTYEIDGAPLPQTTSSNFSELIDPRNIDSFEIFTGAFPAEFGGSRMGAVVNIITKRPTDIPNGAQTFVSAGGGTTYGTQFGSFDESVKAGATEVFVDANAQRTARGLDSPTQVAIHDDASLSDYFIRTITQLGPRDTLSADLSNQYNTFQIPINTSLSPYDPVVDLAGQDDVQLEYNSFANLNYTHTSRDGNGYVQVIPWWRFSRTVYEGDIPNDVRALDYSSSDCSSATFSATAPATPPCPLDGLSQDRGGNTTGLRTAYFRTFGAHAFKTGVDYSVENFTSTETIVQNPLYYSPSTFADDVAKVGTALGAYVEDNWTPSARFSLQAGLRYDRSDGFTSGNELQPRLGANLKVGAATIFHVYYGRIYAAPALEDTRLAAVVTSGGGPLPAYDLKPEHDSYYEAGVAQTFSDGINGYVDAWERNAWNVLDTTQIFPTPIFAVYNNSLGLAHGYELRLQQNVRTASWYLSGTYSQSVAGGISGGTFLFPPSVVSDTSLEPEDHDQTVAINDAYTKRFGADLRSYVTLGTEYGTGYPVQFQNGTGRLPPHLTFDFALGREPQAHSLGYKISAINFTDYQYLIKVANGFNTTQWAAGAQVNFALEAAF